MKLVETRIASIYRVNCPHCRLPTVDHPEGKATVTLVTDEKNRILGLTIDCDSVQRGQDRT